MQPEKEFKSNSIYYPVISNNESKHNSDKKILRSNTTIQPNDNKIKNIKTFIRSNSVNKSYLNSSKNIIKNDELRSKSTNKQ